jgi:N-acetylmuramoyl-L-alanine amidase
MRIVHPADGALLGVDSTFLFGSVGSGDATLRVNGVAVPVANNGAFLAWLAVPRGTAPVWELDVRRGTDSLRVTRRLRRPVSTPLPATGPLRVDSASVQPNGALRLRADERVRVSVRAPANATAWVRTSTGRTVPLVRTAEVAATTLSAARPGAPTVPLPTDPANVATLFAGEVRADQLGGSARLLVARDRDTVRLGMTALDVIAEDAPRRYAVLKNSTGGLVAASDTDRVVNARPVPDGFSKWQLFPGTQLEVTGRQGTQVRVRLDSQLEVWVPESDIVTLPDGAPAMRRVNGGLRVLPATAWVDVIVPTGARPAFLVDADDARLVLTLYDTQLSPEISPMLGNDPLVRQLAWEPVATDRTRLEVRLSTPVYGWLPMWDEARRALVLRVRRPPVVNARRPLEGLVLAVDAGHPPGGATGPTGLTEPEAALAVSQRLRALLEARGATVVMTRTDARSVSLTDRPVIARRANAHAFLSVHLNAFGDGTNPFTNHGTSTLFLQQPSEPLARAVQRELMAQIGQRDLGVHYQSLAVARATWYPSILAEGLFLMFPDQEAALRTPAWQERYARGIADGVEAYFRTWADR